MCDGINESFWATELAYSYNEMAYNEIAYKVIMIANSYNDCLIREGGFAPKIYKDTILR